MKKSDRQSVLNFDVKQQKLNLGTWPMQGRFLTRGFLVISTFSAIILIPICRRMLRSNLQPVFVNLWRNPGIDSLLGGPLRPPYLSYRPARLAESIPLNRFLGGSVNVYKYGLRAGATLALAGRRSNQSARSHPLLGYRSRPHYSIIYRYMLLKRKEMQKNHFYGLCLPFCLFLPSVWQHNLHPFGREL